MNAKTAMMTANLAAEPSPLNLVSVDPFSPARSAVAIIGMASATVRSAPLFDPAWEVWGLNNNSHIAWCPDDKGGTTLFRADRWFELHPRAIADDERAVTDLATACCYVVDAAEWPGAPRTVVTFPRTFAMEAGRRATFASTFSWQVALAIAMGFTTIGVFGVELNAGREGLFEKASLAYWLGLAEGRGIDVVIPAHSTTLWHPALYGLEYWKEIEYVGHLGAILHPSFRKKTHRPPSPRPAESFEWERQAREQFPDTPEGPSRDADGEPLP